MGYIYDDSHEYTGSVVEFNNDHGTANITSLTVPFSPIQDLNGYSHPWPAGGGVNKYPLIESSTISGITLTNDNGVITLNGTATADAYFDINNLSISVPTGEKMYICAFNPVASVTRLSIFAVTDIYGNPQVNLGSANATLETSPMTENITVTRLRLRVPNGETYTNFKLSPYLQVGGTTPTAFSPYENLCPISGRTGLSVYVSPTQDQQDATTYAVDWTSEAGTVYGGTLDVVTGLLTVDRFGVLIDGSTVKAVSISNYGTLNRFGISYPSGRSPLYTGATSFCIADKLTPSYECTIAITKTRPEGFYVFPYYSALFISMPSAQRPTIASANDWFAANTPVVVYELATPLTYQLTPQEVETLVGENNIWADTEEDITVTVSDIMYGFRGWLLKVGSGMTLVPTSLIQAETYKVTPDQRMEQSAERDVSGYLWRDTVANQPPKIEFETPACYNTDVRKLTDLFIASYTNRAERKLPVAYYDPEEDVYKSTDCYIPNIDFPIRTIDIEANTIMYDPIRFAFIGY